MTAQVVGLSSLWLITVAFAGGAVAHELRPAVADIEIGADRVVISIDLTLEPLAAGMDLTAIMDTNDSPKAATHDEMRALPPEDMAQEFRAVWPQVAGGITLLADDERLELQLDAVVVGPVGNVALARDSRIVLSAAIPPGAATVRFGWEAGYGAIVVRQISGSAEGEYSGYLTNGALSEPMTRGQSTVRDWGSVFVEFLGLGYEHIVPKGLDHILFVLGLFFFSLKMRPLLWQVSAFTLAHTTTLALAALGIVSVPSSIVETLIAASIAFVAVENILARRYNPWRTAVVFGFGLLHGLGFAAVLGEIGLAPGRFVTGLIAFNLGVEAGQLTVIAAAFLLVASWAGRKPWYQRRVAWPASAAIAVVGAWWFVERVQALM